MSQITINTSTNIDALENGFHLSNNDKNFKNQTSIINKTCNFIQYNQTKIASSNSDNCSNELKDNTLCHIKPQQSYQYQQNVNKISRVLLKLEFLL